MARVDRNGGAAVGEGGDDRRDAGDLGFRRDRRGARHVNSPPMSMMSAPAASIARPAAMAPAGSLKSPPSEKLSGVTLTMPMTSGRSKAKPAHEARRAARAASCPATRPSLPAPCCVAQRRSVARATAAPIRAPSRSASASTWAKARGPPASGSAVPSAAIARAAAPRSSPKRAQPERRRLQAGEGGESIDF